MHALQTLKMLQSLTYDAVVVVLLALETETYEVAESTSTLFVNVSLIKGSYDRNVTVSLSTLSDTAISGMYIHCDKINTFTIKFLNHLSEYYYQKILEKKRISSNFVNFPFFQGGILTWILTLDHSTSLHLQ